MIRVTAVVTAACGNPKPTQMGMSFTVGLARFELATPEPHRVARAAGTPALHSVPGSTSTAACTASVIVASAPIPIVMPTQQMDR